MPKKPKTPSSRLAHWQRAVSKGNPFELQKDWNDRAVWTEAALNALDLDVSINDKWDKPIREAFNRFKLDPRNPLNWRLLLSFYAQAHVSRGRPKEWASESLCNLLRQISLARAKRPNAKPSEIYRSLIRSKASYSGKTEDYVKHGHRLALDLNRNEILRNARDLIAGGYIDVLCGHYQEKGWRVTASDEKGIKDMEPVLDDALALIGAPNSRWAKK
jgi:hypothetical protein